MIHATELRTALIAAFPPVPITRAMIDTPDARWSGYEERDDLARLEGKAWTELEPELLERHGTLLVHTGGALYRAILPAYLLLLAEHELHTALPFHVAGQVTRGDHRIEQEIFDERVGPMTAEQRAVVRRAIALLAKHALMKDVMKVAFRSW